MPASAGWLDLADSAVRDRFAELLAASPYVPAEAALAEVGRFLRARSTPVQTGLRAAEWTHETLRYERGATHVRTSSAEARAAGKGCARTSRTSHWPCGVRWGSPRATFPATYIRR